MLESNDDLRLLLGHIAVGRKQLGILTLKDAARADQEI